MNINLNDLKDSLEFTKISWDTTNEFNTLISVMTFLTCVT